MKGVLSYSFAIIVCLQLFNAVVSHKIKRSEPVCSVECGLHAICIGPEKCACEQNYEWNLSSDSCTCSRGYIEEDGRCEPLCSDGCQENSICVAPELCHCMPGYDWNVEEKYCQKSICNPPCGSNSFCSAADQCTCLADYKPDDIHSLNCSSPVAWWIYLIIALVTVLILCTVGGVIYYFFSRNSI